MFQQPLLLPVIYISPHWMSKSFFFLKSQFFRSAGNVIQQIKKVWSYLFICIAQSWQVDFDQYKLI